MSDHGRAYFIGAEDRRTPQRVFPRGVATSIPNITAMVVRASLPDINISRA